MQPALMVEQCAAMPREWAYGLHVALLLGSWWVVVALLCQGRHTRVLWRDWTIEHPSQLPCRVCCSQILAQLSRRVL